MDWNPIRDPSMYRSVSAFLHDMKFPHTCAHICEVGSRMWGSEELSISSDHDIVVIYQERTRAILSGKDISHNYPSKHHLFDMSGREFDFSFIELGHFCNLLKKGNANALWIALTPLVYLQDFEFHHLCKIIWENPSRACIPSVFGMATSQRIDVEKRSDVRPPEKSWRTALRTLGFAWNLLKDREYSFKNVNVTLRPNVSELTNEEFYDYLYSSIAGLDAEDHPLPKEQPVFLIENALYQMRMLDLDRD